MTYRERRLRKAERLREWAAKREMKAEAASNAAHDLASQIPLGQPILVGHHSEARARKDVERIHNRTRSALDHAHKAEDFYDRANNIEKAADRAIYSDDEDAIDCLKERIAELEAKRDHMKAVNAYIKANANVKFSEIQAEFSMSDADINALRDAIRFSGSRGYPAYAFTNLSGNISKRRKRLAALTSKPA